MCQYHKSNRKVSEIPPDNIWRICSILLFLRRVFFHSFSWSTLSLSLFFFQPYSISVFISLSLSHSPFFSIMQSVFIILSFFLIPIPFYLALLLSVHFFQGRHNKHVGCLIMYWLSCHSHRRFWASYPSSYTLFLCI